VDAVGIPESNVPGAPVLPIREAAYSTEIAGKVAALVRTRQALGLVVQLVLLVALSQLADLAVRAMQLPVPSNAVGMLVLFLLLHFGVLRLDQIDAAAALFVRHLAFFFIPIAVGLMAYRDLLATTGAALLVVIAASALIGMLVAGLVVQLLSRPRQ
jgi:holin-like protein